MKVTKQYLKQVIKEELEKVVSEQTKQIAIKQFGQLGGSGAYNTWKFTSQTRPIEITINGEPHTFKAVQNKPLFAETSSSDIVPSIVDAIFPEKSQYVKPTDNTAAARNLKTNMENLKSQTELLKLKRLVTKEELEKALRAFFKPASSGKDPMSLY